jgi:ATP-dependent DNA helicase PIF1
MLQNEALDILKTGENVYLTGYAGAGKTFVLSKYIAYCKQQGQKVGITASTGVAATQLGGMTINAWASVGIKRVITRGDIIELLKRRYLRQRIKETDILIIDEISMLPAHTLEAVDAVCRALRRDARPFGGMQVVLCGDFFQLPPVEEYHGYHKYHGFHELSTVGLTDDYALDTFDTRDTSFVYKSPLWDALDLQICYLEKPYRQVDLKFLTMLQEIRENKVTRFTWDTLRERFIQPLPKHVTPTKLYTHTKNADWINEQEINKLEGPTHTYHMQTSGSEHLAEVMKKSCLAPERLVLKKNALVMFVKNNIHEGYVNGTMGRITRFTIDGNPVVETFSSQEITVKPTEWIIEEDNEVKAKVVQIPLRLAWAITIHKSQGMTLDAAEIDLGKSFVTGMGYVALSRVKSLEGLRMKSVNRTALTVNEEVIELDRELREKSERLSLELRMMGEKNY